jgi:formamidopyrimidine-DNA glycosylase
VPELPEVETVRQGLRPVLERATLARVIAHRPDLRFPLPEQFGQRLAGRTIVALGRRAKYLMADLDDGTVLVMHLGMTGRFIVEADGKATEPGAYYNEISRHLAHDHVVFETSAGGRVVYNDVRRFGFMALIARQDIETHPLTRDIGIEPLGNELTPGRLAALFQGKATPLKAALLDQSLIAGLGNIYVCEALHRSGLSPRRAAGTIVKKDGGPTARAERLTAEIRAVLEEAIAAGGSTLRDFAHADGALGYFQHRFKVYDREGDPCPNPRCTGCVERIVQSNRSTFFCARCQR